MQGQLALLAGKLGQARLFSPPPRDFIDLALLFPAIRTMECATCCPVCHQDHPSLYPASRWE